MTYVLTCIGVGLLVLVLGAIGLFCAACMVSFFCSNDYKHWTYWLGAVLNAALLCFIIGAIVTS